MHPLSGVAELPAVARCSPVLPHCLQVGNTELQQATTGNSVTPERRGCMVETLSYNGQLLATQQQLSVGGTVETLATLGYNGQLLATQQLLRGDGGDSGNPSLGYNGQLCGWQLSANGPERGCMVETVWQHWGTTGNCW